MGLKLLGLTYQRETKDVVNHLENANIDYTFIDLGDGSTKNMEMLIAISGSNTLPQLFDGGENYVGQRKIDKHIGS